MSEETSTLLTLKALLRDPAQLLLVGNTLVLGVVLILTTALMFLLFAVMNDASALRAQAKKSDKAAQALRAEIADIKDKLKTLEQPTVPTVSEQKEAAPAVDSLPTADPLPAAAAPRLRPAKARAEALPRSCEFRPGNGGGLVSCIRLKT